MAREPKAGCTAQPPKSAASISTGIASSLAIRRTGDWVSIFIKYLLYKGLACTLPSGEYPHLARWLLSESQSGRQRPSTVGALFLVEAAHGIVREKVIELHCKAPINIRHAQVARPIADAKHSLQIVVARPSGQRKTAPHWPAPGNFQRCRRPTVRIPQRRVSAVIRLIRDRGSQPVEVAHAEGQLVVVVVSRSWIVHVGVVRKRQPRAEISTDGSRDPGVQVELCRRAGMRVGVHIGTPRAYEPTQRALIVTSKLHRSAVVSLGYASKHVVRRCADRGAPRAFCPGGTNR